MRPIIYKRFIVGAILCQQLGYFMPGIFLGGDNGTSIWGLCNALTHVVLIYALYHFINHSNELIRKDYWSKKLTQGAIILSINQLADENVWLNSFFGWEIFNPYKPGLNELLIGATLLIIAAILLWKRRNPKR